MNENNQGRYTGNYNETWQLDHIIPISTAETEEEIIKLNHYSNFMPLCSRKNLEKSNTINNPY
jgi:5-methylcytosine-specific restriction endonuclease McrA